MRDFDEARRARQEGDRSFKIGGQEFTRRTSVRPDILNRWDDVDANTKNADALAALDELILEFIEPGEGRDRWVELRKREDDPITLDDMMTLADWLVEEATGRPTPQPSDSSGGHNGNGTVSTGVSSLPVTPPAQTVST